VIATAANLCTFIFKGCMKAKLSLNWHSLFSFQFDLLELKLMATSGGFRAFFQGTSQYDVYVFGTLSVGLI